MSESGFILSIVDISNIKIIKIGKKDSEDSI